MVAAREGETEVSFGNAVRTVEQSRTQHKGVDFRHLDNEEIPFAALNDLLRVAALWLKRQESRIGSGTGPDERPRFEALYAFQNVRV